MYFFRKGVEVINCHMIIRLMNNYQTITTTDFGMGILITKGIRWVLRLKKKLAKSIKRRHVGAENKNGETKKPNNLKNEQKKMFPP